MGSVIGGGGRYVSVPERVKQRIRRWLGALQRSLLCTVHSFLHRIFLAGRYMRLMDEPPFCALP